MRKISFIAICLAAVMLLGACGAPAPTADPSKPSVSVSFGYEDGLRYPPSYAIWMQDDEGNSATLFATGKAATGLENRPAALPVWKGVREADVVSGATPSQKAELTLNIPDKFAGKECTLYIEANASYDYNDYYAEGLAAGDEGYNDVNGQPSAVWAAKIDASASGSATPSLAGTGDVLGADHAVHDKQHLTTAAELLTNISITWDTGK